MLFPGCISLFITPKSSCLAHLNPPHIWIPACQVNNTIPSLQTASIRGFHPSLNLLHEAKKKWCKSVKQLPASPSAVCWSLSLKHCQKFPAVPEHSVQQYYRNPLNMLWALSHRGFLVEFCLGVFQTQDPRSQIHFYCHVNPRQRSVLVTAAGRWLQPAPGTVLVQLGHCCCAR